MDGMNNTDFTDNFLELITTQLRFYMVSPQLSLLIILTMQSYKFYLSVPSIPVLVSWYRKISWSNMHSILKNVLIKLI